MSTTTHAVRLNWPLMKNNIAREDLDAVLVREVVGAFDCVERVPFPRVALRQGGVDAPGGRDGVGAQRTELGDDCDVRAREVGRARGARAREPSP